MIDKHYRENKNRYMKRLTFRAGTEWDAEDILHDAYERALKYAPSFNGDDFGAWFNTIVNNALRDHMNASKGYFVSIDDIDEEAIPCPHYTDRVLEEVYEIIKSKPTVQREVLTLHIKQDYAAIDVSRITDYSYTNCRQIIHQFRKEMKQRYGKD